MTHDDASVETGVGGQAKYDVKMVFCGNALQKHHKTLKTSTRRCSDCHILHILNRYREHTSMVLKLFVPFFANCSLLYLYVIWYMFACVPQHTGQERV